MCPKVSTLIRVLIADQRRIVRAGIRVLLSEARSGQPFEVIEAETTEQALTNLTAGRCDVVLMEYFLPGRGGVKTTELMLSRQPKLCILGVNETDDAFAAEQMVRAGAMGCILKNIEADTLVFAIRTVLSGKKFYSNEIALSLLDRERKAITTVWERLTAKEMEIFKAILKGLRDREIAEQMGIAKRTVDKHRQHIHFKLGTRNALELVQAGLKAGLVRVPD